MMRGAKGKEKPIMEVHKDRRVSILRPHDNARVKKRGEHGGPTVMVVR